MKCPICGGISNPKFEKHNHIIYMCQSCSHEFINLVKPYEHTNHIYDDTYFFDGGSGYLDYTKESELLIAHGERYGDILKSHTEPSTFLDVGSAAGFILEGLENKGWKGQGIEPNDTMARYAREKLEKDVLTGIFEQYEPQTKVNLVTMIQVIAHFYDVRQAIEVAKQSLNSEGLLLIETWDRASLLARLFGSNWHEYSPPSVVNWFSIDGLNTLVEQFGFVEVARGRPSKRIKGSHAKSLVNYKIENMVGGKLFSNLLNIVPDSLQIPYPSFDLFWILYKLSD